MMPSTRKATRATTAASDEIASLQLQGRGQRRPPAKGIPSTQEGAFQIQETRAAPESITHIASSAKVSAVDTVQPITTIQSTEIIQTFLYSAFSSILLYRRLLPQDRFKTRFYATINHHWSYHDFVHGEKSNVPGGNPPGCRIAILRRGQSRRGDQIIAWLENGAFGAIQQGYVERLQLSICPDPSLPSNIAELYQFNFRYANNPDTGRLLRVEADMSAPDGTNITLKDVRGALNEVVHGLVALSRTLPDLPDRRHVQLHLVPNAHWPRGYKPKGFAMAADDTISFSAQGREMNDEHFDRVGTNFQSVDLQVFWASPVVPMLGDLGRTSSALDRQENGPPLRQSHIVPSNAHTHEATEARNDRSKVSLVKPITTNSRNDQVPGNLRTNPNENSEVVASQIHAVDASEIDLDQPLASADNMSKVSRLDDSMTARRLRQMQQPATPDEALEDTQVPSQPQNSIRRTELSQDVIRRLNNDRSVQLPPRKRRSLPPTPTDTTRCQCGQNVQEYDMIYCSWCDTWQHLHCYGYCGAKDARIPQEHACYPCLLENRDDIRLIDLEYIARIRRLVHCLEQREYNSEGQLSSALGLGRADISGPLDELKREEFITIVKGLRGTSRIALRNSAAVVERMAEKYFDPTYMIAHLTMARPIQESLQTEMNDAGDRTRSRRAGERKRRREGDESAGLPTSKTPKRTHRTDLMDMMQETPANYRSIL